MNEILVKLYIPTIDEQYDIWIPINKRVHSIIRLLIKAINELSKGYFNPQRELHLYDKITAKPYDMNLKVIETDIRNGSELILM